MIKISQGHDLHTVGWGTGYIRKEASVIFRVFTTLDTIYIVSEPQKDHIMRKIQLMILVVIGQLLTSSAFSQKTIKGLINAEKAFAAFTITHTIKEGFLNFMDSTGVVFRQGNAVNALDAFRQQKAGPGLLTWGPDFAVISASGDMGVTAGPFEFREKSSKDTPVNKGRFSSIWQINSKGEWKNLADLGIAYHSTPAPVKSVEQLSLPKGEIITFNFQDVLLNDHQLNEAIQRRDKEAWKPFLAAESLLHTEGHSPYKGVEQISAGLKTVPQGTVLQSLSGGMASSRDFAYTYGTVLVGDKKENYLRAWICRNGRWQVVMQTMKW